MTEPTLSVRLRAIRDELSAINGELTVVLDDAIRIGLAPFRILSIQSVIANNHHSRRQLHQLATAIELTHANSEL